MRNSLGFWNCLTDSLRIRFKSLYWKSKFVNAAWQMSFENMSCTSIFVCLRLVVNKVRVADAARMNLRVITSWICDGATSPASEPKQKCGMPSPDQCCLLITWQLRPTHSWNSSRCQTASHRHARTSGWPSAWRKRTSWQRSQRHRQSSPSTTANSKPAPPSPTTSRWTHRSTRGSGRQLQLSPASLLACG